MVKVSPQWVIYIVISPFIVFFLSYRVHTSLGHFDYKNILLCVLFVFAVIYMTIKSTIFHYDAPHQQIYFYHFIYLIVSVSIYYLYFSIKSSMVHSFILLSIPIASMTLQAYDIYRFFPNLLFYGTQYGENFLGEFYGPAVIHGQDTDQVKKEPNKIFHTDPNAKILIYPGNAFKRKHKGFVYFFERDPDECYDFAFAELLYLNHWRISEANLYKDHLREQYPDFYTYYFLLKIWMYKIYKREQPCPPL